MYLWNIVFNMFIYFQSTYDLILFHFRLVMILVFISVSWGFVTLILTVVSILNSLFRLTFLLD